MTVYKAFRNLIIALAIVGIIVTGSLIGFSAYRIYDYAQNSQYVVSKLGSTGDEVNKIQKKLSSLGFRAAVHQIIPNIQIPMLSFWLKL